MSVIANSKIVFINHEIGGKGLEAGRLGPMSTELAMWLDWKFKEYEAIQTGDTDTSKMFAQYFKQGKVQELATRSNIAALKGYNPPLATETGKLTQRGLELARLCNFLIKYMHEEMRNTDKKLQDFSTWTSADDLFIMADLSIRVCNMLKLIDAAIVTAETSIPTKKLEIEQMTENIEIEPETESIWEKTNRELREMGMNVPQSPVLEYLGQQEELNVSQSFTAITIEGAGNVAYVPTATFGQRARNDLKILLKYGLVDLKRYITGERGRPRHIIKVSTIGKILLTDLNRRGIL